MRSLMLHLHRYMGLTIAAFLVVSGLTGAIISWDHELDEWLNPHLNEVHTKGEALSAFVLADKVETEFPKVEVTYFDVHPEPGHSQYFWVQPRVNPETGHLYKPEFNQVYVDPVSGDIIGKREWGAVWPITRETFMSFLYKLHYSLHIPEFWGTDHWGIWLLGVIALIWTFDCFVGAYLTLPKGGRSKKRENSRSYMKRWAPSWKVRRSAGPIRFNFDLHRALGLWTWGLLFVIAFTAFSLNLYREVFFPVMSAVSDVTPSPLDQRTPNDHDNPITPTLTFADVSKVARQEADAIGWSQPVGSIWYARDWGIYRVEYFAGGDSHGSGGVGHEAIFFDGHTGEVLGDFVPWEGTAADIFVQAQFPLHSGRILGLPGRILISIMGIVVAALSITGVIIWYRKHKAKERRIAEARQQKPASAT
ncbi:PepSY-associated TM helix domain-containing protein [Gilvimarinus japonicus]|uniref:PepSY-associated TM helix domain-containing protein n=1 Tax=Gilvimarinus japonicus TaxID=1796469 RepID=A0ABV7HQA4_9GAMM